MRESRVVPFVGAAWTNEPPLAAPTVEADSASELFFPMFQKFLLIAMHQTRAAEDTDNFA